MQTASPFGRASATNLPAPQGQEQGEAVTEQHSLLEVLDENALSDVAYHLDALIRAGQRFSATDLRARMSGYALSTLKEHPGTFGAAFRRAVKAKRIRKAGYVQATHADAHNRIQVLWEPL